MNAEMSHFLNQGPHTASDLARLTGKSVSTIYKALKASDKVLEGPASVNGKTFYLPGGSEDGPGEPEAPGSTTPADEAASGSPAPIKSPAKRGRPSGLEGRKLQALVDTNVRRKGSHGYKSLQIILDKPGISHADFLAAGGRSVDVRWDIERGNVKLV